MGRSYQNFYIVLKKWVEIDYKYFQNPKQAFPKFHKVFYAINDKSFQEDI